jgi:hypothetical protein
MYKSFLFALLLSLSLQNVFAQQVQGAFTAEQYKKALWMVTRFYGGQRDGHGPNWLLMDHTYKTSFLKDGQTDNIDLVGGWFDCGDHVLFGQTFFYSVYMLAKAYEVFPTGFHDLYDGKNYSDYAASGDWSIAGGSPNGIPDLLEEIKYATDWIIKATPNASTFYYQKGNGGGGDDHKLWVTSAYKALQPRSDGGESDQPRPVCKNPEDVTMASFAAGALAVMSKIYEKYDPEYAAQCSTHALYAYTYAKSKAGKTAGSCFGGFYGATNTSKAPLYLHVAAAEMYKMTGESTYLNDMITEQINFHNWGFDYDNPHDLAAYASATTNNQSYVDNMRTAFVNAYTDTKNINSEGINTQGNEWGAMRYVANHAFTTALYSDVAETKNYDQFIYNQVDYILGKNSRNYSFLVGFDDRGPGMASSGGAAQKPHHRNVYLNDDNVEIKNSLSIPVRNKYFGYMVGGHREPNKYEDNVDKYESTEGGLDYQAGFVGVLAYIVSKLEPADTSKFSSTPPEPPVEPPSKIIPNKISPQNSIVRLTGTYEFPAQNKSFTVQIFNLKGNVVSVIKSNGQAVKFTPQNMGVYYARVRF